MNFFGVVILSWKKQNFYFVSRASYFRAAKLVLIVMFKSEKLQSSNSAIFMVSLKLCCSNNSYMGIGFRWKKISNPLCYGLQEAKRLITEKASEADYKLVLIGDKAKASMQIIHANYVLFSCNEIGRLPPTFEDASLIAASILSSDFKFDKVIGIFHVSLGKNLKKHVELQINESSSV